MARVWYFAYGSNMQTATFRGRRGIEFARALPGQAVGWRLVLDKPPILPLGAAMANVIPEAGAHVLGVLYDIDIADMAHIDLTEGVLIGNYRRIEIAVTPLADPAAPVTAHTLTSDRRAPELQPSDRYMSYLIAGAEEHGLPAEYVAFLRAVPSRPESAEAAAFRPFMDEALKR